MREDRVIGAALALMGVGMVAYSMTIAAPFASSGDPGPAVVPTVLGVLLAGLGLLLALRKPVAEPEDPEDHTVPREDDQVVRIAAPTRIRQILLGVSFVAFVALFDILGFSLSAILFLLASMVLLGPANPAYFARAAALSVCVVLLVGFILNGLLDLSVPGVWIG